MAKLTCMQNTVAIVKLKIALMQELFEQYMNHGNREPEVSW